MTKTVLDVGNCNPDHSALSRMLLSNYDVRILRTHELKDSLEILQKEPVHLIMINRKLDMDYSDGLEILKVLKRDEKWKSIPAMIITNYPEHQEAAVEAGADYGFGKLQFAENATHERLSRYLDKKVTA